GIHYQWSKPINQSNAISGNHLSASNNPIPYEMYRLDMELVGAKKPEAVIVDDRQPYYEWYYLPHCGPDGVKADAYHRVVYCEVYPNIDWVLYIKGTHLEYDFVIRPGGSVSDIQMQYKGAEEISILPNGNLCIKTPEGRVTEQAPYSFVSEGKEIHSSFHLNGDIVSFDVEAFAATETLVIDPVVQWATYYGGSDGDYRATVTCDTDGNVYMSGDAASRNNIATSGSHQ